MSQAIYTSVEPLFKILDGKKSLLVCGPWFDGLEIAQQMKSLCVHRFSEFAPNPVYGDVYNGVALFNREHCDAIIAVGGGSAIDVAKCIKLFCRMNPVVCYLDQEKQDSGVLLVAIPTTAGSGSESTCHAVIYRNGAKQSISHPSIIPDYAILEPSVLKTLSVYQKKCTMLDALCQGIESWWSINSTNESKEYSKAAVKGVVADWQKYIENNDETSSKAIMEAANFAGRAINITATTAPHAMSYKLTSMYHIPHGHAVALCLPEVWDYMLAHTDKCIDFRGSEYLKDIFSNIESLICLDEFRAMMNKLGMERPTSNNIGIDLHFLVESVNPVRLKNNPVALSVDVLLHMYERILCYYES